MKFKFLDHTADIKFRAFGKNLNEAFDNSALAIIDYISRGEKIKEKKKKRIRVKGIDEKALLYNFLDEIIYLLDAKNFVVSRVKTKLSKDGKSLTAEAFGDDSSKYEDLDHIKAATYAEMEIKKVPSGLRIQAVMDV